MIRTILALILTIALTGAAQAREGSNLMPRQKRWQRPKTIRSYHRRPAAAMSPPHSPSWTHKIKTFLDTRIIQENCLATAVYFEARSESQLGQLAVATVILNRVKASNSPSSICGVVYRGASRLNACQFSFACDGKADLVDDARAWKTAHAVTALALADDSKIKDGPMQILATATNYHADYVDPYWSKSLNRLTKIGRHIFYSQS